VGRTLLDRELYLPASWTDDRDRCAEAGVPAEVGFATKPELATQMIERALDAGMPASWVTGDEAYGQVSALRRALTERGMSYVLAVPSNQRVHPAAGGEGRIDAAVTALAAQCWTTITVGAGAKGPRTYQWARARVRPPPEHRGEPELSEDGVTCRLGDDVTCRWVRRGDYGMAAPGGVRVRSLSR
jgi:hypothetical protein